jgi:hypothetical protein
MRNSFPSQIYFVLPSIVWVAFVMYQAVAQITAQKQNYQLRQTFVPSLRNKWITEAHYRTADTRKPRVNAIVRRLACFVAWKLSSLGFLWVALPFPQVSLLHSVTCVQLRLITIFGNCGCQFPFCTLTLTASSIFPSYNNNIVTRLFCTWQQ